MIHIRKQYENQIEAIEIEREKLSKKEKYLPLLRFVSFLFSLILIYNYLIFNNTTFVYFSVAVLFSFVLLTFWNNLLKGKIERADRLIQICRNEIKSMNGDFSAFESGDEYIDTDHSYSFDLDIFGKNSLFHCINRSVTIFGKNRLAEYFKDAYNFKDQIFDRQKAIIELSENKEFRQQMQLLFFENKSSEKDRLEFREWLESDNAMLQNRFFNVIKFTLPIITNTLIVLSLMNFVVVQFPIMMVILQLLIVSTYRRKTLNVQSLLTSKVDIISKYAQFLLLIEKNNFKAPFLVGLKQKLSHEEVETPSQIIRQLSRLLNWIDSNLNVIAAVILNGLFLFNLHLLAAVDNWKSKYSEVVLRWFGIMGEFDALASLANFTSNNPDFTLPEPITDQFFFEASNLGHPLISKTECVTNNITMSGWNQFCIITGANMSGKSTFLRTVGTNYV